jgi:hypothetical protein
LIDFIGFLEDNVFMSLAHFSEAGYFNKPIEVDFDLNPEQLKSLLSGEKVEVLDNQQRYSILLRPHANLQKLTQRDLIINRL